MTVRRRLLLSLAGLACVYAVFIAVGDARAWSGSDAGGKVATIRHMDAQGTWRPDVGYWAERADPDGAHHPLIYTTHRGGRWVQVTSLPFVYLGLPLYRVGGAAALLVLPALGSLLAAYAARRLARALGAARGWGAFWIVGLASPMLFYAGDFWEHSAAVGLALLALAMLMDTPTWRGTLLAGGLAGLAAVLRTEVLIYVAAVGVGVVLVGDERRAWLARKAAIAAAAVGVAAVVVTNLVAERAIIGETVRSTRAGAQVAAAGSGSPSRLSDGVLTLIGLVPDNTGRAYALGIALLAGLLVVAHRAVRRRTADAPARAGAALVIGLAVKRFIDGLGFVPGALSAAPVSAAGIVGATRPRSRVVMIAAIAALPLVWLFEWQGQLVPQWGGRYVLLTGALLTVVGAVALEEVGWRRPTAAFLVASAVAVTAYGAVWHAQRTRGVARAGVLLAREPRDEVVISSIAHLGRELGAFYGDRRWLNGAGAAGVADAAAVAAREGATRVAVVSLDDVRTPPPLPGFAPAGRGTVPFLGFRLVVWRYAAAA